MMMIMVMTRPERKWREVEERENEELVGDDYDDSHGV